MMVGNVDANNAAARSEAAVPFEPAVQVVDFSFRYPKQDSERDSKRGIDVDGAAIDVDDVVDVDNAAVGGAAFKGISFHVDKGAFCVVTGSTGSGKTTLLRCMKPELAPVGTASGSMRVLGIDRFTSSLSKNREDNACQAGGGYQGEDIFRESGECQKSSDHQGKGTHCENATHPPVEARLESARSIGFVMQDPAAQIVCDTVWHELAFGLENIGMPQEQMRRRVAEVAHFFGIEPWVNARTESLSGGQKQLVNLAAVLALRPQLLLIDEPTAQLDPNAVKQFVFLLARVNRELGVTVIMATHSPEDVEAYATQFVRLDDAGESATRGAAAQVLAPWRAKRDAYLAQSTSAVRVRGAHYRFSRKDPWVLRGVDLDFAKGAIHAIVGGNGCGKTTLLRCIAGVAAPQRGKMENSLAASQAMLPQDPKALLVCDGVHDELMEWSSRCGYDEVDALLLAQRFGFDSFLERHPYDLSGGQQQKLALAKVLLTKPQLLLLDEPTKGIDPASCADLSRIFRDLAADGMTIVLVTHDLDFAEVTADRVSMLFDGEVACTEPVRCFFESNLIYKPNEKSRLFGAVVANERAETPQPSKAPDHE